MHMDEILNGMTKMTLERIAMALNKADLDCTENAVTAAWHGDHEEADAWVEAGKKVWLMHSIVEDALLTQQAKNK